MDRFVRRSGGRARRARSARAGVALAGVLLGGATCAQREPGKATAQGQPDDAVTWSGRTLVDAGEAHRGPWRMNESDYRWVDDPTVELGPDASASVAWVDQSRKDVLFQRFGPDGRPRLSRATNVSNSPRTFSWLPRVAVSRSNPSAVFVLWQEIVFSGGSHGGEIFFAASGDGGETFGRPVNLSNTKAGAGKGRLDRDTWDNGSLALAQGPGGELHVAWTEYEGGLWFRRSTDAGATFSGKRRIAGTPAAPARGPSLAVGSDGAVHLAWTVGEDREADVRVASSTDRGASFGRASVVAEDGSHSDAPALATGPNGTVHLVYAEGPGVRSGAYDVRYTRRRPGANAFEPPRTLAGVAGGGGGAHFPEVEVDGRDNVYVLWESYPDESERARGLGMTFSRNGGDSFARPRAVPAIAGPELGINGSQQGKLTEKLDVHDDGALAVVNSTFRPDEDSAVWLLRGRLAGE